MKKLVLIILVIGFSILPFISIENEYNNIKNNGKYFNEFEKNNNDNLKKYYQYKIAINMML